MSLVSSLQFKGRDIISIEDFSREEINYILKKSQAMEQLAAQREERGRPAAGASSPGPPGPTRLVMAKAPILRTRLDPEFAEEMFDRLRGSERLRAHLGLLGAGASAVPVAFPRPGPNWYREHHGQPQISFFVFLVRPLERGAATEDLFEPGRRELLGAFTAEMDFKIEPPNDSVGTIATIGPRRDLEERWRFFLSGVGGGRVHAHRH